MTETTLSLLIKGREYLARPDVSLEQGGDYFGTLGYREVDDEGIEQIPDHHKCCGIGAIAVAVGCDRVAELCDRTGVDESTLARTLANHLPGGRASDYEYEFYEFNDTTASKDDMLAVFDAAITALTAQATA
jgi:hypothetical protein